MKKILFFNKFINQKKKRLIIAKKFKINTINKSLMRDYKKFGKTYFDSSKAEIGYKGYNYDGRFKKLAKQIINYFKLAKNSKVLELGCAKGFFLVEFLKYGMNVFGLDKSKYAIKNCHKLLDGHLFHTNIEKKLNFDDDFFDLVICKEVFPHITPSKLDNLIEEIIRVVKNKKNIILQIQTFKKKKEKKFFKKWDLTHKSIYSNKEWNIFLNKHNFKGHVEYKYLF